MFTDPTLFIVTPLTRHIFRFFRRLGAPGLVLFGALDSSFLFLPFGNDILLIGLVSARHSSPVWILYVLAATLGSIIGVFVLDLVMRKLGEKGLKGFVSPKRVEQVQSFLKGHAGRTLFFAAMMPPPFPFTVVVMVASALQSERRKVLVSVTLGRLVRFTVEAILALYMGRRLVRFLNSRAVEYAVYFVIVVSVIGSIYSVYRWFSSDTGRRIFSARAAD